MSTQTKPWEDSRHFEKAVKYTLLLETGGDLINGGLTNDPYDSGGATKWGISQKAFPNIDVRALTLEDAKKLYFRYYYSPVYDQIDSFLIAFKLMDMSVLMGRITAIRLLQGTIGVSADGHVGPVTIEAINARREADLVNAYENRLKQRINYLVIKRPTYKRFKKGWYSRIEYRPNNENN